MPSFSDSLFQRTFRLSRSSFHTVLEQIKDALNDTHRGRQAITAEKQLAVFCRYLGSRDTIIQLSHLFDITEVIRIRCKVCGAVLDCLLEHTITWPELMQQHHISDAFNNMGESGSRFRGVVGCIDGTHILILKPPGADEKKYFNRKLFHSIILQGTCRENLQFIVISVGCAGCMHDANTFQRSGLHTSGLALTHPWRRCISPATLAPHTTQRLWKPDPSTSPRQHSPHITATDR